MANNTETNNADRKLMSTPLQFLDALRSAIVNPTGGVVGLVDQVLALYREHHCELDWRHDRCRVRSAGCREEETIEVPLRKSVFRAILARIATLCSDNNPESFSPYGGRGELSVGPAPSAVLRVVWVNTTEEQRLELAHADVRCEPAVPRIDTKAALESGQWVET